MAPLERVGPTMSETATTAYFTQLFGTVIRSALILFQSIPYFMSSLGFFAFSNQRLNMFCIEFGFKILFIAVAAAVAAAASAALAVASHIRQFFAASGCHLDYVVVAAVVVVVLILITAP